MWEVWTYEAALWLTTGQRLSDDDREHWTRVFLRLRESYRPTRSPWTEIVTKLLIPYVEAAKCRVLHGQ